jgi:hypothetical protein
MVAHECRSVCSPAQGTPARLAAAFTARNAVEASRGPPSLRSNTSTASDAFRSFLSAHSRCAIAAEIGTSRRPNRDYGGANAPR